MRGLFRRFVVVIYWLVLPLVLLACGAWLIVAALDPSSARSWAMAGGAAAFAGLIGWRLWLNSRAMGWASSMPTPRRRFLVFAPLSVVTLAGIILIVLGLAWLTYGFWLTDVPQAGDAAVGPLIGGVLCLGTGAMLTAPLMLLLRRRSAKDVE